MAAPAVSGIVALLRTVYADREKYSTKFIQSQLINTTGFCADALHALTDSPKPSVKLYDYRIDDSTDISPKNNGNGVMDAGETVRLYVSLQNRGGVASNVQVTLDTLRMSGQSDPYFTLLKDRVALSDIGTYSVRAAEGEQYFEIEIHADCPNDYLADFNLHFTYSNGMIATDETVFSGEGTARFNVSSGYHLPAVISEDIVFEANQRYIVGEDVIIAEGVTVTFKEGCEIQFYDDREYYNSPRILVYGTLNLLGSNEKMVTVKPSERNEYFFGLIYLRGDGNGGSPKGKIYIDYANLSNIAIWSTVSSAEGVLGDLEIHHSLICNQGYESRYERGLMYYEDGAVHKTNSSTIDATSINNCVIDIPKNCTLRIDTNYASYNNIASTNVFFSCGGDFNNNIVYSNNFELVYGNNGGCDVVGGNVNNNLFIASPNTTIDKLCTLSFRSGATLESNYFSESYRQYAYQVISDYIGSDGKPKYDLTGSCSDLSALYPHITDVAIFNKGGEQVTTIGKEPITVRVTFNRAMDTTKTVYATFGTRDPYGDYRIDGKFVSDTVWEGTYTLKAYIENGLQRLIVHGACAAEDATKEVHGEYQPYEFNIDTTTAMAMNLTALPDETGIRLTWNQDDYATLMGYNLYRCDTKNGNYVRINPSVLLASEESFLDTNAEPGKTYWYTFTVVLSDFSETPRPPAGCRQPRWIPWRPRSTTRRSTRGTWATTWSFPARQATMLPFLR